MLSELFQSYDFFLFFALHNASCIEMNKNNEWVWLFFKIESFALDGVEIVLKS